MGVWVVVIFVLSVIRVVGGVPLWVEYVLLGIKFAPDTELARELLSSGNKLLAETGKGKFYPCGLSIADKNILDTSKWSGNVLGKLLGKIRLALRG